MNHAFKRTLSFLMALAMVLSLMPSFGHVHAHAEEVDENAHDHAATEPAGDLQAELLPIPGLTEEEMAELDQLIPGWRDMTQEEIYAELDRIEASQVSVNSTQIMPMATTLTTSVTGLTASWDYNSTNKNGTVTASGDAITIKATGGSLRKTKIVLTLTNNLGEEATLRYSYTQDGGSLSGASGEATLANGASTTITFESGRSQTNYLYITGISLISTTAADPVITFKPGANGSYTVNGTAITVDTAMTVAAGTELALVATPASGYQFFGWQKADGAFLSQDASYTMTAGADETITPVFIDTSIALFGVGATKYDDLTEAGAAAAAGTNKTIILLNNGTVSGSHTIPKGTTLLIPYDDANTAHGANASCTSWSSILSDSGHVAWVSPTAYRTLTLAGNANITVNGNIEVGGRHAAAGGKLGMYGGSPTGSLGYINMLSGSHIDLNSGANLYCWGYIYGDGTITAKSGSSIYENFQIMDFRGGSVTMQLASDYLAFPLSQYYVQNVEVATRYEYGATEYVATSIFMSNQCHSAAVKFIGEGAMFQPASGSYFVKDYNPATDMLEMHAYGSSTMASMNLELGGTAINSADFVLPITNNIAIHLHSGTTTLKQNMMMLPGSRMTIDQGATLNLAYTDATGDVVTAGGYVLQVFDSENWTSALNMDTLATETGLKFVHPSLQFRPVAYTCTSRKTRTNASLTDVTIDINGTVVTDGFMYSTVTWKDAPNEDFTIVSGGANVISSGKTGVVAMNSGAGADQLGYLYDQAKAAYYFIPLASVQLKNGDGTLVDTSYAAAGDTYTYCAACDVWGDSAHVCTPQSVEITWIVNGEASTQEVDYNTVPVYNKGTNPTKAYDATYHYTFKGWATSANGTVLTTLPAATEDATYYAVFTSVAHSYTEEVARTAATCKAEGSVTKKCTCGAEKTETLPIDKTNHTKQNTTVKDAKDPTCEGEGYTGNTYCECGEKIANGEPISATGHKMQQTAAQVDATCEAEGKTAVLTCANGCGKTEGGEPIPALGHTPDDAVTENEVAATCGAEGSYDTVVYCSVCDAELSRVTTTVPATGNHNYVTETERVEATCTVDGYVIKTCGCGATEKTTLTAPGHTAGEPATENEVAATCTENGSYDTVVYCSVCDAELSRETTTVDALGHTPAEAVTENEVAATCGADGSYDTVVYCSVCDAELSRVTTTVPATGNHNYVTETERVEATCTVDGYVIKTCGCGATEKTTLTAPGHTAGEPATENEVAATCTENGSYDTVVYCSVCDAELSRVTTTVDALGHTPDDAVTENEVAATCGAEGSYDTVVYCSVCDAELSRVTTTVPATGEHVYVPGEYTWAKDFSSCTVTGTCGCGTTATAEAEISTEVLTAANCTYPAYMKFTATFEETWTETQTREADDPSGELDSTSHMAGGRYRNNNDGTHTQLCQRCGVPIAEPEAHGKDRVLVTGNCLSPAAYQCYKCGTDWAGEKNPDVHAAGSTIYYKDITDETHTAFHPCCNAVIETVPHDYTTGTSEHTCICGKAEEFTITWTVNGEIFATTEVEYGAAVTAPDYDVPEGHTFSGWDVPATMPAQDITLDATLTVSSFLIDWFVKGWNEDGTDAGYRQTSVKFGDPIKAPGMSWDKEGYTFTGWQNVPETMPAENIVIYGEFVVNKHDITWDVDGETTVIEDVAYGTAIMLPEEPSKTGYNFAGWQGYTEGMTMPDKDVTFTAQWEAKTYTVTWIVDGETYTTTQATYGEAIALPETAPTKTGHTFNGWKNVPETMPDDENLTIEAEFTANVYQVHWYANGGYFFNQTYLTSTGTNQTYGEVIQTPPYNAYAKREGYTFTGWNTEADGSGEPLTAETIMTSASNTEVIYYAQWQANTYTVTWTVNGEVYTTTEVEYGAAVTVPDYDVPEGHTFSGWEVPATMPAEDLTLDASLTVNTYTLFIQMGDCVNEYGFTFDLIEVQVPYGALLKDYLPETPDIEADTAAAQGVYTFDYWYMDDPMTGVDVDTVTMPAVDTTITGSYYFTGWRVHDEGKMFVDNGIIASGWFCVDGNKPATDGNGGWYYGDLYGYVVTGLSRVFYPAEAINGVTYAPNAEDVAYYENKGKTFIDKDEAWFVFGEDGKFQSDYTGMTSDNRWAVNGMLAWHPGLVLHEGSYYYFLGEETYGGNFMASGDVYMGKNSTDREVVIGGVYTYDVDGKLFEYDGITRMGNGTLRYYEDARLMMGAGLVKVGEEYIYVRSNGELVVDAEYYVPANSLNIAPGTYTFDDNGFLVMPEQTDKDGIYYENGGWFYYENGVIGYNKGLIEVTEIWYTGEGPGEMTATIYVRSNGQLATGYYYVTNLDNYTGNLNIKSGDKLRFGNFGTLIDLKNGIVAEGDKLYYYVDNVKIFNAGVIELNGNYYYVRSNGEVVKDCNYWITNVGDSGIVAKMYTFDANGVLQNPEFVAEQKNGIVDGYYYVNGNIAYGAGLLKLSDENGEFYIYVRSNGQLATGTYWVTNNPEGYDVRGSLDFGTDGKCYI